MIGWNCGIVSYFFTAVMICAGIQTGLPHSRDSSSPVATFIYGDKININIWEPTMLAIVIKSKEVADTYRKHFQLLWETAKKK